MMFHEIVRLKEFERDIKKLLKKYRTLEDDLETFIRVQLISYHKLGIDNKGVFRIGDLGKLSTSVYKAKKFACLALKGKGVRTGIRIIYAYSEDDDRIELIEIYIKSEKEVEDRNRIKMYYEA